MTLELADDRPPLPPADLILRVAPSFDPDNMASSLRAFDVAALAHLQCFERALAIAGHSFADFDRLLDFGCGCGRFLRHLGPLADRVEIHGTDIDNEMIEWLRANVLYGRYVVGPHEPPLCYPDGYFNLIINHSVFTHLDERLQDLWLSELQRIACPGALVLLTIEGTSSWNRLSEVPNQDATQLSRWRAELETRGILFIRDDILIGSTHPDFYHSTIHAPWYVFEHWTRFFDIVAYLPDGSISQDLVVLRRRPDGAQPQRQIRARAVRSEARVTNQISSIRPALRRLRRHLKLRRELNPEALNRELRMLRAGLYEQGNRMSVLASQLRQELESLRSHDDPPNS